MTFKPFIIPCRCGKSQIKSVGPRSMSRCGVCKNKYGYSVQDDGTVKLFENGKRRTHPKFRRKSFNVTWSEDQDEKTKTAGWTRTRLLDWAYQKVIMRK